MTEKPIGVLGAGSWGTALAVQFARTGRPTTLWGRNVTELNEMAQRRENQRYLPGAKFPPALTVSADMNDALFDDGDLLVSVPSHAFREILVQVRDSEKKPARICWATKGFELETGRLPHEVALETLGDELPLAVLSGPTFAKEVGAGLPTAMTVASNNEDFARDLAESISDETFRAYTSGDMIGVEVGGAVKNVLAIGAGLSDGLGFGANTRIAMINRGLIEMTRLGLAIGAQQETFMGLAGMGDLVLTCTDNLSRNRRMGLALAKGMSVKEAEEEIQQVVEGVLAAKAVHQKAAGLNIEMPICEQIYRILYEDAPPADAVKALMSRGLKAES